MFSRGNLALMRGMPSACGFCLEATEKSLPARVWDSRETYLEVGGRDIRDWARSP